MIVEGIVLLGTFFLGLCVSLLFACWCCCCCCLAGLNASNYAYRRRIRWRHQTAVVLLGLQRYRKASLVGRLPRDIVLYELVKKRILIQ